MSVFRCKCVNWGLFVFVVALRYSSHHPITKKEKNPWIPRLPFFLLVSCWVFLLFTLVVQLKFIWKDETQVNNSKESGLAGLLEKLQHNGFKTSRNTRVMVFMVYYFCLFSFFFKDNKGFAICMCVCGSEDVSCARVWHTLLPEEPKLVS